MVEEAHVASYLADKKRFERKYSIVYIVYIITLENKNTKI